MRETVPIDHKRIGAVLAEKAIRAKDRGDVFSWRQAMRQHPNRPSMPTDDTARINIEYVMAYCELRGLNADDLQKLLENLKKGEN